MRLIFDGRTKFVPYEHEMDKKYIEFIREKQAKLEQKNKDKEGLLPRYRFILE